MSCPKSRYGFGLLIQVNVNPEDGACVQRLGQHLSGPQVELAQAAVCSAPDRFVKRPAPRALGVSIA